MALVTDHFSGGPLAHASAVLPVQAQAVTRWLSFARPPPSCADPPNNKVDEEPRRRGASGCVYYFVRWVIVNMHVPLGGDGSGIRTRTGLGFGRGSNTPDGSGIRARVEHTGRVWDSDAGRTHRTDLGFGRGSAFGNGNWPSGSGHLFQI